MQSPKPMQYILFVNTISKFKIEGDILLSFLQRISYNVYLTTALYTISQNVFLTTFFLKTTSSTSISQRLSHDVFPTTSSFLTTTFQQCFSYNVISQRLSYTGSVAKIDFEIQVYSSIFKDFHENIQGFS